MTPEQCMHRALQLAAMGLGSASPNPLVGCVIVHQDRIIGEGWHQQYGGPHAEVNAIASVANKSLLAEATCYVTLEPCSHFGKTPPCVDLLIKHRMKKVVICNKDPFDKVNGSGIKKLQNAGIEVETGLLEKEGAKLNRRFFTTISRARPYVILKWAETADGFLADIQQKPISISGDMAQMHSHKWRTEEDAIMVGASTYLNDQPRLDARAWKGRNPVRLIWDPQGRVKEIAASQSLTYIFSFKEQNFEHASAVTIPPGAHPLDFLMNSLKEKEIGSLIVEGGPRLHQIFLDQEYFDEIRIFKSKNKFLKEGVKAAKIPENIELMPQIDLLEDFLTIYYRKIPTF